MTAVSVVLPVYNAQRFLAEAVESILAQTFRDFEFLIVDDGSTDSSPALLRAFAARDSRVKLTTRPNKGLVATLNEMLADAKGEFVARMDADDVALPERFARQVAFLRARPEVVMVGSRVEWIDPEGSVIREFCHEQTHDEIDRAHLASHGGTVAHPAVMIRASALREVGGYHPEWTLSEDFDLWLRMAEVGRLANLPEVLLKYRLHADSRGYMNQHRQVEFTNRSIREACARRGIPEPTLPVAPTRPLMVEADHRMIWAWWALNAGNVRSARKNALRRVRLRPLSKESWRVLLCALRGH